MVSHASQEADPLPDALAQQSVLSKYPSIDATRTISAKKMSRHGQQMDGSVEELNISDNPVGLLGTRAVSKLLTPAFNPVQRLTKLILNKCDVPDLGGMALAQALQRNATLTELQISGNQLSDAAAAAFGKTLQLNCTLEMLDLSWNNIKVDVLCLLAFGFHLRMTNPNIRLSALQLLPGFWLNGHFVLALDLEI